MSVLRECRAFICGVKGLNWSADERAFLRSFRPWGLILFKRNIAHPQHVRALCDEFRELVGREDAPVLVDQEGGRVQRLGPPHWPLYPAAHMFDGLKQKPFEARLTLAGQSAELMARDLHALGITVDCLPVLDVPASDGHQVIGDRAYSDQPDIIAAYGRSVLNGLGRAGVLGVIKHIPGHGRARADSHLELPIVHASVSELEMSDFRPFAALAHEAVLAMTAHVVYHALDPDRPATTSPYIIDNIIRKKIGYHGLLMSDDVSMQALSGSLEERCAAIFGAGVDVVLHCNGELEQALAVAKASPILQGAALERATAALKKLSSLPKPQPVDAKLVDARAEIDLLIAAAR